MTSVAPLFPSPEEMRSASLDSIALLLAALRNDRESFELMCATYGRDHEDTVRLLLATVANSVGILRSVAAQSGVPAEKYLAAVAQEIRDL